MNKYMFLVLVYIACKAAEPPMEINTVPVSNKLKYSFDQLLKKQDSPVARSASASALARVGSESNDSIEEALIKLNLLSEEKMKELALEGAKQRKIASMAQQSQKLITKNDTP